MFSRKNNKSAEKTVPHTPAKSSVGHLHVLEQRTKLPSVTEEQLIAGLRKEDRKIQQVLYEKYAPILFGLARRYVKNTEDAEDVLIDGFYKIMTKIAQYTGGGSFEGWMKRIIVNEALMHLRKRHNFNMTVEISDFDAPTPITVEDDLAAADILNLLDDLPTGYRTVFNLYVIEGYKHREIADILNISINTSKSQLILAKKRLADMVTKQGFGRRSERSR